MVKKAKSRKSPKANTRKSATKGPKVEALLFEPNSTVVMTIGDVARAFKLMADRELLGKFIRSASSKFAEHDDDGQLVHIGTDTANFVKQFLANNGAHNHRVGKHIIDAQVPAQVAGGGMTTAAAAGPRKFKCNFGDG